MRGDAADPTAQRSSEALPLESSAVVWERGWVVRLPVRAERIVVDKQLEVYERVLVRRHQIEDLSRLEASVRREELTVDIEEPADVSPAPPWDTASHT